MPLTIWMAFDQGRLPGKCTAQVLWLSVLCMSAASACRLVAIVSIPTIQGPLLLEREHAVDLRHHGGAFADRRRNALGRARAHVADREHAGHAGLERQGAPACPVDKKPAVAAGDAVTLLVRPHPTPPPRGGW